MHQAGVEGVHGSVVPSGLEWFAGAFYPALKRWAIFVDGQRGNLMRHRHAPVKHPRTPCASFSPAKGFVVVSEKSPHIYGWVKIPDNSPAL
jgi:hypothetical protein